VGRRNREAVSEFREREGLPTFYEAEVPHKLWREESERRIRAHREGQLRNNAILSLVARCSASLQRDARFCPWLSLGMPRPPLSGRLPVR